MNESKALIQLALTRQHCTQKELADMLGVSGAQVSKWKKGEHISRAMSAALRVLAEVDDLLPALVEESGSQKDARKWTDLMEHLAEIAADADETRYRSDLLSNVDGNLISSTYAALKGMGVTLPRPFPEALDEDADGFSEDAYDEALDTNPHVQIIYYMYKALTEINGFYRAYIHELIFCGDDGFLMEDASSLDLNLLSLAASKLDEYEEVSLDVAPDFDRFSRKTVRIVKKQILAIKRRAVRLGMPLRAEPMDLVYETLESLSSSAEQESLGRNETRLHPDIYMNELITGMRTIHQVLPAILEKLDIDFVLNDMDFRLGSGG